MGGKEQARQGQVAQVPDSGIELASPALARRFFTTEPSEKPFIVCLPRLKFKFHAKTDCLCLAVLCP